MTFSSFKTWLEMKIVDDDKFGKGWQTDLSKDQFLHFTTRQRAQEIIKSGKLLFRPPYEKFGTDTVDAISLIYGTHLPEVQTTHISKTLGDDADIVAILFKTDTVPKAGYAEEVKWIGDVHLIDPKIVETSEAVRLLQAVKPPAGFDPDRDYVIYSDLPVSDEVHKIYGQFTDDSTQQAHDLLQRQRK